MAAASLFTSCAACPCGAAIGWFAKDKETSVKELVQPAPPQNAKNVDAKPQPGDGVKVDVPKKKLGPKKNPEEWGWQDLQDHLVSKGMPTSRVSVAGGMFFLKGEKEMHYTTKAGLTDRDYRAVMLENDGNFFAIDAGTAAAAKREAASIKDVDQRDVLAWGRFLIVGTPTTRAMLAKALN
jgi:hypothetical protein